MVFYWQIGYLVSLISSLIHTHQMSLLNSSGFNASKKQLLNALNAVISFTHQFHW